MIKIFGSFVVFKLKCNFLKSNECFLNLYVNLYSIIMNGGGGGGLGRLGFKICKILDYVNIYVYV